MPLKKVTKRNETNQTLLSQNKSNFIFIAIVYSLCACERIPSYNNKYNECDSSVSVPGGKNKLIEMYIIINPFYTIGNQHRRKYLGGWCYGGCLIASSLPGFNPSSSYTKDSKRVLYAALLNTRYYKARIKGKVEQSRERSSALSHSSM